MEVASADEFSVPALPNATLLSELALSSCFSAGKSGPLFIGQGKESLACVCVAAAENEDVGCSQTPLPSSPLIFFPSLAREFSSPLTPLPPSSVVLCAQMFVGVFSKENKARRSAIGGRSPSRGGPPIDRGFPELCFSDRSRIAPFPSESTSLSLAFCLLADALRHFFGIPPAIP
ncbi:hypothetical protein CDAR_57861 [Caerostris darwini]|uniref:Uncharacterized protein n=1 Tax=Caerostris darwini TaxID=1538125 RepID=A0AAV4T1B7_9ARAC|nr:hypothetical protein CDAR_57861 [Caerostris darwini]